jgi:superkiller protein 3
MKRKDIKIGRRYSSKPLQIFLIIAFTVAAPFAIFYLIALAYLWQGDRLLAEGRRNRLCLLTEQFYLLTKIQSKPI